MNIEAAIINSLNGIDAAVFADVPLNRPQRFVTVERTGGGVDDGGFIERPTVAVQSWAETRYEAAQLAQVVDKAMRKLVGNHGITQVITASIYNFPSSDGCPRYQGLYEIVNHN